MYFIASAIFWFSCVYSGEQSASKNPGWEDYLLMIISLIASITFLILGVVSNG